MFSFIFFSFHTYPCLQLRCPRCPDAISFCLEDRFGQWALLLFNPFIHVFLFFFGSDVPLSVLTMSFVQQLSEQHGLNTYLHFIRRLIVHSQARLTSTAAPSAFDTSTSLTFRLLVQEMQRLSRDPFLADRFREGVDKGDGEIFRTFDLVRFADRVGLRPLERLVLAASIASVGVAGQGQNQSTTGGSTATGVKKALADQAATIIRVDFENAVLSLCQHPCFDHADLSLAQAGKLLQNLLSDPPLDVPLLDAPQRQALIAAAQTKYGSEMLVPVLQQLFHTLR